MRSFTSPMRRVSRRESMPQGCPRARRRRSRAGPGLPTLYAAAPTSASGDPNERTPADNQTVRNVFVIAPDKKIALLLVYPMSTGRNFDEVLHVIDSLQLAASHKVSTPANWQRGDDVIISGSVPNDEAREVFGHRKAPKPYILRIVPDPSAAPAGP